MDKHCRICHNISCSNHGKNISFLGEGWKCNYIPVPTNSDRIRAMSDEELAVLIAREIVHVPHSGFYVAKSAWLRWLHETVEEQDG